MKIIKFALAISTAVVALSSCSSNKATVSGTLEGAAGKDIVVKKLGTGKLETVDTLKTKADGSFAYSLPVAKGDPDFVYLYYGETPVASLILQSGDKVTVKADTLGVWTAEGSAECEKYIEVAGLQRDFAKALNSPDASARTYIDYYRKCIVFVMNNSKSLSIIPLLSEKLPGGTPVFSQTTDAIHFKSALDSLKTVYPESKYVKGLEAETDRRLKLLQMSSAVSAADEVGYIDIELPDVNGNKIKLSETKGKVVMVFFWASEMGEQKLFNQDVLKPVYRDFKGKGLEIYAVSLDTDKAAWATAVKTQNAGWINVCDGLGAESPVVYTYNVRQIPSLFFIVDGELVSNVGIKDEAGLRRFLSKNL